MEAMRPKARRSLPTMPARAPERPEVGPARVAVVLDWSIGSISGRDTGKLAACSTASAGGSLPYRYASSWVTHIGWSVDRASEE